MNGLAILVVSFAALATAYRLYGRWLERAWGISPDTPTPAHRLYDGVDYVPAKRGVVFGHEFASIAGAAPIIGPVMAAAVFGFGWLPTLLWIILGGIFVGAVQDFAALYASVKNDGKSMGALIERHVGRTGKRLFLLFVWLFAILVTSAFADIVAETFFGLGDDGAQTANAAANGAVATTSALFIAAAVGLGFWMRRARPNGWLSAGVAVALLVACVALGMVFPWMASRSFWLHAVFGYIFVASVAPVWALLQPRDYLNSFLLVAMIAAAFVGALVANPPMNLPAFGGFATDKGGFLFPMLFVTVACGAVSGFHSLVASGTASKQIENERDMLPVSYGAMLVESLLAVLALVAAGAMASADGLVPESAGGPPQIFATAVSGFLATLHCPPEATRTVILLAISAFAMTSLDSVARVGRLAFQELFTDDAPAVRGDMDDGRAAEAKSAAAAPHPVVRVLTDRYFATTVTLLLAYGLARLGYKSIWPLFGAANQLLAALTLLVCALFLKHTKRPGRMLYVPMFGMLAVTFVALGLKIHALASRMWPLLGGGERFAVCAGIAGGAVAAAGWYFGRRYGRPGFVFQATMALLVALCLAAEAQAVRMAGAAAAEQGAAFTYGDGLQLGFALLLFGLGLVVTAAGLRRFKKPLPEFAAGK